MALRISGINEFTQGIRVESDKLKSINRAYDNFHFEIAIYRVTERKYGDQTFMSTCKPQA